MLREVTAVTGSSWYRGRESWNHGGHEASSRLGLRDLAAGFMVTVVLRPGLATELVVFRLVLVGRRGFLPLVGAGAGTCRLRRR